VGQYPPNLLFAAVHYLLLGGIEHALARYYQTLTEEPLAPDGAFALFRDFCIEHEASIRRLVETRLVQTNEVGRCACLLPAFAEVSRRAGGAPLALIDVGAAAGLNLLFDRYFIDYGRLQWGDAASPVHLRCELMGEATPRLDQGQPTAGYRSGVDLNPISVMDADATLWLRALVWPEQRERTRTLVSALELAKDNLPRIFGGDAVELLPALIDEAPADETLCVYHSFTLSQLSAEGQERFRRHLAGTSKRRPVYFLELSGSVQNSFLSLTTWQDGTSQTVRLGECAAHGQWLRWLL
jgi:hypothetical protein